MNSFISDADYKKYSIIKPPTSHIKDDKKIDRIIIDSKLRDKALFPFQNDYEIKFEDDINDVINAKMIYFDCPLSSYLINSFFNSFIVTDALGIDYKIVLSTGNYTESQLVAEIQNKLDTLLGGSLITVTYNSITDHFIFTGASSFTIKFLNVTNNISMILGFENKNYASRLSGGNQVVESVYRKNFNYNNYIVMNIDQFDLLKSINSTLNRSFATIPKQYQAMNVTDFPNYIKYFNPPIPRLTKLRIKFFDSYGNLYDFQNMDHRFELEITSFKQGRKYNDIFTK
jgi:hypothetical protein